MFNLAFFRQSPVPYWDNEVMFSCEVMNEQ